MATATSELANGTGNGGLGDMPGSVGVLVEDEHDPHVREGGQALQRVLRLNLRREVQNGARGRHQHALSVHEVHGA